jgi:hypothetical protein
MQALVRIAASSVAILIPLLPCFSAAGEVRLSFLRETNVLQSTTKLFRELECAPEGVAAFQKAVGRYYANGFVFDFSKFPTASNGWHSFQSMTQLVAALPHRLEDTAHPYEINCFDTVILLSADRLRCGLRADDYAGAILAPLSLTNGVTMRATANARDAFAISYQPWYLEATADLWPPTWQDTRIALAAVLHRWRMLPLAANQSRSDEVMKMFRASWRQDGVKFPDSFEIVLYHEAKFSAVLTTHAGLLIPRKDGYTYIEKAGGQGPFVRLEIRDRKDLLVWFAGQSQGVKHDSKDQFITFNERWIERLELAE